MNLYSRRKLWPCARRDQGPVARKSESESESESEKSVSARNIGLSLDRVQKSDSASFRKQNWTHAKVETDLEPNFE